MIGIVLAHELREQWAQVTARKVGTFLSILAMLLVGFGAFAFSGMLSLEMGAIPAAFLGLLAVVLFSMFLGFAMSMGMIADSIAGERERHTLETLLAGPLRGAHILWGKIFSVAAMSAMMATFMMLLVPVGFALGIGWEGFLIGLLAYPAAFIAAAVPAFGFACYGAIITHRSKGTKEAAQVLAISVMPVYMILAFSGAIFGGVSDNARQILIIVSAVLLGLLLILAPFIASMIFTRPRLMVVAKANKKGRA